MKKTLLTTLLLASTLGASLASATPTDLCSIKLDQLQQNLSHNRSAIGEPYETKIRMYEARAEAAQANGQIEECIAYSHKALHSIRGGGENRFYGSR